MTSNPHTCRHLVKTRLTGIARERDEFPHPGWQFENYARRKQGPFQFHPKRIFQESKANCWEENVRKSSLPGLVSMHPRLTRLFTPNVCSSADMIAIIVSQKSIDRSFSLTFYALDTYNRQKRLFCVHNGLYWSRPASSTAMDQLSQPDMHEQEDTLIWHYHVL